MLVLKNIQEVAFIACPKKVQLSDGRYTEVYQNILNMDLVAIDHRFKILA